MNNDNDSYKPEEHPMQATIAAYRNSSGPVRDTILWAAFQLAPGSMKQVQRLAGLDLDDSSALRPPALRKQIDAAFVRNDERIRDAVSNLISLYVSSRYGSVASIVDGVPTDAESDQELRERLREALVGEPDADVMASALIDSGVVKRPLPLPPPLDQVSAPLAKLEKIAEKLETWAREVRAASVEIALGDGENVLEAARRNADTVRNILAEAATEADKEIAPWVDRAELDQRIEELSFALIRNDEE